MLDPHEALHKELSDRYELEEVLCEGGMGTVYLARETTLDRDVALKSRAPIVLGREPGRLVRQPQGLPATIEVGHVRPSLAPERKIGMRGTTAHMP